MTEECPAKSGTGLSLGDTSVALARHENGHTNRMFHAAAHYKIPCVASCEIAIQETGGAVKAFYGTAPRARLKIVPVWPTSSGRPALALPRLVDKIACADKNRNAVGCDPLDNRDLAAHAASSRVDRVVVQKDLAERICDGSHVASHERILGQTAYRVTGRT